MASAVMQPIRDLKVATEVWIAVALLHREQPDRQDFTIDEIVNRVQKEGLYATLRPGVRAHALIHCVANRTPNPANHRMLYAPERNTRRLYRQGDPTDPKRTGRVVPDEVDMPKNYAYLLEWYESEYAGRNATPPADAWLGSLTQMDGLMKGVWGDADPDMYVAQLREDWDR